VPARSLQDYNKALKLKPDFIAALNNRGIVYLHMGLTDRAIQDFTAALQQKPGYELALYNRGIAYQKKGDRVRAAKDFKQSGRTPPTTWSAGLGTLFSDDSETITRNTGNHIPTINPLSYVPIAPVKIDEQQLAGGNRSSETAKSASNAKSGNAASTFFGNKSVSGDNNLGPAIQELGERIRGKRDPAVTFRNGGDHNSDASIANLTQLIRTDPTNAFAFNARGEEYEKRGDYDRAIQDFTEALQLKPEYPEAKRNLEAAMKAKHAATR